MTEHVNQVLQGDNLEILRTFPAACVDAVVTDPPYGLAFMGKHWDYDVPTVEVWRECLRVLKPGGHLLSFAGTRTYHRMTVNIEDAGFEIRDMIAWVYGQGFPKSLDVSKAIDNVYGATRELIGKNQYASRRPKKEYIKAQKWGATLGGSDTANITIPATASARQWQGWGTALKPAIEPICVARKPLIGTVAENVLQYGTGGINVDGCRVEGIKNIPASLPTNAGAKASGWGFGPRPEGTSGFDPNIGRWPANLIHDGSEEVVGLFPTAGDNGGGQYVQPRATSDNGSASWSKGDHVAFHFGDSGSAARFFYCAKASKEDRDEGCYLLGRKELCAYGDFAGTEEHGPKQNVKARNNHPTVKPTALMRYLCRLVTPPGGIVLDPFFGSGSTGKAAKLEYFNFIGIEREAEYCEIARKRIDAVQVTKPLPMEVPA